MKKFEGLGRSLSKEQQKRIVGGACSCTCSGGSTGSWTYDNNAQNRIYPNIFCEGASIA